MRQYQRVGYQTLWPVNVDYVILRTCNSQKHNCIMISKYDDDLFFNPYIISIEMTWILKQRCDCMIRVDVYSLQVIDLSAEAIVV